MRQRAPPDTSSDELGRAKILTQAQTYSEVGTGLQHLETSLWCMILGENFVNILSKLGKKNQNAIARRKVAPSQPNCSVPAGWRAGVSS